MAQYPTSAATDANLYIAVNSLATSIVGALTSMGGNNGPDIEVTSTSGFPTTGFITVDQEAIAYTGLLSSPARFTGITRGADGTIASSHAAGSACKHNVIAAHHNVLKEEVKAVETDLVGIMAALVPVAAANLATSVLNRVNMFANQIKLIAGLTNWYDTPNPYTTLFKYRRPVLQWASVSTVNVQDQIVTGTGGDCTVMFSDGKVVTVNSTTQTRFDITRNASLSGTKQSGLRTGSEAANTWYALYAVRATDNDNTWVTVGDTVAPVNSGISTLNTNFGTGKWCFLGWIKNGNGNSQTTDICKFVQSGNMTILYESNTTSVGRNLPGIRMANNTSTNSLTYSSTFGTGATDLPSSISMAYWCAASNITGANGNRETFVSDSTMNVASGTSLVIASATAANVITAHSWWFPAQQGAGIGNSGGANGQHAIHLQGWIDDALGVGSNPLV